MAEFDLSAVTDVEWSLISWSEENNEGQSQNAYISTSSHGRGLSFLTSLPSSSIILQTSKSLTLQTATQSILKSESNGKKKYPTSRL